jgi:hypothetical protein
MSISHLSLVNQKLAFAGAIIRLLNAPQIRQPLEQQALVDAAAFHLAMGLHFYLRELAEHHRIKNVSAIYSVQDLVAALQQSDSTSSESSELLSLTQANGTWLHQLTGYYTQLSKSPEKPKEKKAFGQENLIDLVELTEVDESPLLKLTPELLASWFDNFRVLVLRQRDTSAEY